MEASGKVKTITEMKKSDFKQVPHARWNEIIRGFNSLVIIPTRRKHESGFMCMEFCAVDAKDRPIKILSGCSDILRIDGIGGYGKWDGGKLPSVVPPKGWSVDCLPCGYLRLFSNGRNVLTSGEALSSFEVFAEIKEEKK